MDCSTPGFPVHHQLLKLTQTHVHWVSDAIQLSYPLSSPSPPAFNLSQHQGLFQWFSPSYQVTKYQHFSIRINSSNDWFPSLSSVQFSHWVVSDSLQPHGLQHARPPCPSPTPGVHSNPCSSSRWCHPAMSSSVISFSCHQVKSCNSELEPSIILCLSPFSFRTAH